MHTASRLGRTAVVALAGYRLWRLAAVDDITAAARDRVAAVDHPAVRWAYTGLTCPWCAGTWIALAVAAADASGSRRARVAVDALAAAAAVGWIASLIGTDHDDDADLIAIAD